MDIYRTSIGLKKAVGVSIVSLGLLVTPISLAIASEFNMNAVAESESQYWSDYKLIVENTGDNVADLSNAKIQFVAPKRIGSVWWSSSSVSHPSLRTSYANHNAGIKHTVTLNFPTDSWVDTELEPGTSVVLHLGYGGTIDNLNTFERSVSVQTEGKDGGAIPTPEVSVNITNPSNNSVVFAGSAINIQTNITSRNAGIIRFLVNGQTIGEQQVSSNTTSYSQSWTPTRSGDVTIKVAVFDNSGSKMKQDTVRINVKDSVEEESLPVIRFLSPQTGSSYQEGENVTIEARVTDEDSDLSRVNFFANNREICSLGATSSLTYSCDWTAQGKGNITLRVDAIDAASHVTRENLTIQIESDDVNPPSNSNTPVGRNGRLRVCENTLCNERNEQVQLRGMSSHGIQWLGNCLTDESLDTLAYEWNSDLLRISMYVQEGGYETDPEGFTNQVNSLIEMASNRGMYVIVDWHQLTPGDPNANTELAIEFFTEIAKMNAHRNNIIYDVANEPNNVSWSRIRDYAMKVIPVVQRYDSDAVVLIGTHAWASMGVSDGGSAREIVNNPIPLDNIMYTYHFYAASHGKQYRDNLEWAAQRLPIFVTEWGTQNSAGEGANNFTSSQAYLDIMNRYNISWANWNYSDDWRSGAVWKSGTCSSGNWSDSNLKEAGLWIKDKIKNR
ncbi:TPA: cellulase family glycosylhydrolase [Vibrio alginolyticus]